VALLMREIWNALVDVVLRFIFVVLIIFERGGCVLVGER